MREWRRSHTGSRRDECDDWFIAMYADDFFFVGPPEIAAAIYPYVAHTWRKTVNQRFNVAKTKFVTANLSDLAVEQMTQRLRHAFAAFQKSPANVYNTINSEMQVNHYHDGEVYFGYGTMQIPVVLVDTTLTSLFSVEVHGEVLGVPVGRT